MRCSHKFNYEQKSKGGTFLIVLKISRSSRFGARHAIIENGMEDSRLRANAEHKSHPSVGAGKIERILAPMDFSEASKAGLRYALNAAGEFDAEVIAYHAITAEAIAAAGRRRRQRRIVDDRFHGLIDSCKLRLRDFIDKNFADAAAGLTIRTKVDFGPPERNIIKTAAAEKVDLIVMSRRRRKGALATLLSPSVTEAVSGTAPCPVLAVPANFVGTSRENYYKKVA
jgi:nucleotide-binding universal stress UspA family protein